MKKEKTSIAMATYNGENHLLNQLDSISKQLILPDELIVTDDFSQDSTIKILNEFQRTAPFEVKIIQNKKRLGYAKNFMKALSYCSGDIIFLSDQDDEWFNYKIQNTLKTFKNNSNTSILVHDGVIVTPGDIEQKYTKQGQIISLGMPRETISTGALSVIKQDILPLLLPYPTCENMNRGHDGWIHAIGELVGRRLISREILQKIIRHGNNTSEWIANSSKKLNRFDRFLNLVTSPKTNSYQDRIIFNRALFDRFNLLKESKIQVDFEINTDVILNKLSCEMEALLTRQKIINASFIGRINISIKLLRDGSYRKYFNGVLSFFRDIVR